MGWRDKKETSRPTKDPIENIIGRSCVIRGDLNAEGSFRIDGTIEGSVESRGAVVIGEGGCVRGDVSAGDIIVAGQIEGHVRCSGHLEILAKGRIEGDIDADSVRVETGGVFRGTSRMGAGSTPHAAEGAVPEQESEPMAAVSQGHLSAV